MNARSFQAMVPMRDGTRLNTFVFLPDDGGPTGVRLRRVPLTPEQLRPELA
jgi:predicted acyl esterase